MIGPPVQGLAEHKDELGAPLCPCRHYDDKVAEAQQGFWNCPCVPMRERKVNLQQCPIPNKPALFVLVVLRSSTFAGYGVCHIPLLLQIHARLHGVRCPYGVLCGLICSV